MDTGTLLPPLCNLRLRNLRVMHFHQHRFIEIQEEAPLEGDHNFLRWTPLTLIGGKHGAMI